MLQSVVSTCLALLKEGVQNQPNGKYGIEMAFHNNFFLRIDFFEYFEFFFATITWFLLLLLLEFA